MNQKKKMGKLFSEILDETHNAIEFALEKAKRD